jgi:hypothetical protein
MLAGFQAKISLLSQRKLVSANSYAEERWALMVVVLEGSPVPRSTFMISESLGETKMAGFFAGSSKSSKGTWVERMAISCLSRFAYVFAAILIACVS